MKSKLLIGAVALVFVGVLAVAFLQQPSVSYVAPAAASTDSQSQTSATQAPSSPGVVASRTGGTPSASSAQTSTHVSSGYTMAQVARHDSASSCWTAIDGNVYDLTNWINQHPGGPSPILSLCGTDGSAAFNAQHGGQGRPARELAQFLLGPLAR